MQISPLLTPIKEVAGCCFQHPSMQHLRHCCGLMGNYKATRPVCLTALCRDAHDPGMTSESVGNHLCPELRSLLAQKHSSAPQRRANTPHIHLLAVGSAHLWEGDLPAWLAHGPVNCGIALQLDVAWWMLSCWLTGLWICFDKLLFTQCMLY